MASSSRNDVQCCCLECLSNPGDLITFIASVFMILGLVFMTIGYVVPRDYDFNPYAPAREMEAIEIYFANLSYDLDVVITAGMGFVAFGGILMTSLVTYEMYLRITEEDDDDDGSYVQLKSYKRQPSYGSAEVTRQGSVNHRDPEMTPRQGSMKSHNIERSSTQNQR